MENLNLDSNTLEILDDIFDVFVENLKQPTSKQISRTHSNASSHGVFYNDDVIVFTNEATYNNWLHYAGYSYNVEKYGIPNQLVLDGDFILVMESDKYPRVGETIERLTELEDEE